MNDPGVRLQGLILAAGYGSRLAPLTDLVPKPLLPVQGKTLLDHAVTSLEGAGIRRFAVNTHHLGEMVVTHIDQRPDRHCFEVFPEDPILGTGGVLAGARSFLEQTEHFVIHNGDVFCDADLAALVQRHLALHAAGGAGPIATLLLTDWPAVNTVAVDPEGWVRQIGGPQQTAGQEPTWLTYTGIAVFSRGILDDVGPGFSSLIDPLRRALARNPRAVRAHAPGDFHWSDLGTPARYLASLEGRSEVSSLLRVERITGHGSDRRFWRLGNDDRSLVAMVSPAEDPEFARFVAVGRWLREKGLGVPEILAVNEEEHSLVMQDVGADRLYERAGARDTRLAEDYHRVLDRLLAWQDATDEAGRQCPLAVDRTMDHGLLRWESDYFRERFLVEHSRLPEDELRGLDGEFDDLARSVARQPLVLMHRDFQSQNIHFHEDRVFLVDYQGLRLGPLGYDVMSLIMDPYVHLEEGWKDDLLVRFAAHHRERGTAAEIEAMCVAAGLQRLLQALGAYAFLGRQKNKPEFLGHIPRGLDHLQLLLNRLQAIQGQGSPAAGAWLPESSLPRLRALVPRLG